MFVAATFALAGQLAPASPAIQVAHADSPRPKAVFIVGPSGGMTNTGLADAETMADQAEAVGMDVRRVFFPNATWDNVLANVQGASLVMYIGHGYGWPSPYTKVMTESRQNGMGLNSFAGSGPNQYTYYGAIPIKTYIELAPNAVVILVHGCYTAGNGEPGMAIPGEDLARQRVDNFANGFLAAGAGAVFAFGWNQRLNYPNALMNSSSTMDQMFMTSGGGSPAGFVGWKNRRFESQRTPGAMNHLDPHSKYGYYRALSGNLNMTAADWRAGAAGEPLPPPPPPEPAEPPQITALSAVSASTGTLAAEQSGAPSFHPNGDGLEDELLVQHTVTRAAYLDATVTNSAGQTVRSYSVWSTTGTGTSRWNGKNDAGAVVADGPYDLTYVPRDTSGVVGQPVSTEAMVLTAIKLAVPTRAAIHVSDADSLFKSSTFKVTLNQPARLSWRILNAAGDTVRTVRSDAQTPAGVTSFAWNGKSDAGAWVADGRYVSVVSAQTGLGQYSQQRTVFVGAFRITPSISSPARGAKITLNIVSTEGLSRNPRVTVAQPDIAPWTVATSRVSGKKYRVTLRLKTGGSDGTVEFVVMGVDTKGRHQSSALSLPLR